MALCSDDFTQYKALMSSTMGDYLIKLKRYCDSIQGPQNQSTRDFVAKGRNKTTSAS